MKNVIIKTLQTIVTFAHLHKYFPTLEKIGKTVDGKLTFDGKELKGSEINKETIEKVIDLSIFENCENFDKICLIDSEDGNKLKTITKTIFDSIISSAIQTTIIAKAILFGGEAVLNAPLRSIETFSFATSANATSFGNLQYLRSNGTSFSNSLKAIYTGGRGALSGTAYSFLKTSEKVNFTTEANSVLSTSSIGSTSKIGLVSGAYEVAGMYLCGDAQLASEKFVFSTEAISTYYSYTTQKNAASFSTKVKMWIAGGFVSGVWSRACAGITFSNATTYNNFSSLLLAAKVSLASAANSIKGLFMGGTNNTSVNTKNIEYVNCASVAAAINFGNLTETISSLTAVADTTKCVCSGGYGSSVMKNTIEYVNFATLGNAIDFGDLIIAKRLSSGASNSHGGLSQ